MVCGAALLEVAASPGHPAIDYLVSVIGVAAGVATLVIALSMNSGFRETLQDRLLGVTAHISLTRAGLRRNLQLSGVIGKTAADARSAFGYTSDL